MTNLDRRLQRLEKKLGNASEDDWAITVETFTQITPASVLAHTLRTAKANGRLEVLLNSYPGHTIRLALTFLQGVEAAERMGVMHWNRPASQAPRILNALACLYVQDEVDLNLYRKGYLLDEQAAELHQRCPDMDTPKPMHEIATEIGDLTPKFTREALTAEWSGYTDLFRPVAEHIDIVVQLDTEI